MDLFFILMNSAFKIQTKMIETLQYQTKDQGSHLHNNTMHIVIHISVKLITL